MFDGARRPTRLAWFVEATGPGLREYIWIDARHGGVALHFSQLDKARNRAIYTANSTWSLPGSLVGVEEVAPAGDADATAAYDFAGDTYDYFLTEHGRDSYDGLGAPLVSTVHYCPGATSCPYQNAFWDGVQMVYGEGFSKADDVDAHELTHAVTEHTANLYYYMQSGALNESFSDMFGEAVDLWNTDRGDPTRRGNDTAAVRWLMGEDVPGLGAIRNMMNPNQFGDPGKTSDTQYYCDSVYGDNGGVHTNSGVPNHAFALSVDGGTYNGITVSGIGLRKAAQIQYRVLTQYLTSAADFLDYYDAVGQACGDLVGGAAGITASDCQQVRRALDAVQIAAPALCNQAVVPDLCPAGKVASNLFFDDFESGLGNWSLTQTAGYAGDQWALSSGYATSGTHMLMAPDPSPYYYGFTSSDVQAAMTSSVADPVGRRSAAVQPRVRPGVLLRRRRRRVQHRRRRHLARRDVLLQLRSGRLPGGLRRLRSPRRAQRVRLVQLGLHGLAAEPRVARWPERPLPLPPGRGRDRGLLGMGDRRRAALPVRGRGAPDAHASTTSPCGRGTPSPRRPGSRWRSRLPSPAR